MNEDMKKFLIAGAMGESYLKQKKVFMELIWKLS